MATEDTFKQQAVENIKQQREAAYIKKCEYIINTLEHQKRTTEMLTKDFDEMTIDNFDTGKFSQGLVGQKMY